MLEKGIQGFQLFRAILPYTRSDIHFRIVVENGRASLVNILRGDTYTADVSAEDGIVSVENIAYTVCIIQRVSAVFSTDARCFLQQHAGNHCEQKEKEPV